MSRSSDSAGSTAWDPEQYERFKRERQQPFFDLLAMVEARPAMRVIDLGCGTGELTRHLHETLEASETLGIDSSPEMLARSSGWRIPGLEFELCDIAAFRADHTFDLVFSNAALQWIPDHPKLFTSLAAMVADGGQLAVQIPGNHRHPSHTAALAAAAYEPFSSALGDFRLNWPVLETAEYAELLLAIGLDDSSAKEVVYSHELPSSRDVVEWSKGTLLTAYKRRLPDELHGAFSSRYEELLLESIGEVSPYTYPFRRILMWGRKPHA